MSISEPRKPPPADEFDDSLLERRAQRTAGFTSDPTPLIDVFISNPLDIEYVEPGRHPR